jgi:hypothetical protein
MSDETGLATVDNIRQAVAPVVRHATEMTITNPADYAVAAETLKQVKGAQKRVDAELIAPWRAVKANAVANMKKWDDMFLVPLVKAEDILKEKQLAYDAEQERIRQAEQRRLQAAADEAARKEREKAEAAARLQREKEAAARAEQERQEALARKARNEVERQKAAAAAEAARKVAEAAAAKAAVREDTAAAVVAPVVSVASVRPMVSGQSFKKTWRARVVDPKVAATALLAFPDWQAYVTLNQGQLDKFAARTKGAASIAGVEW